MGTFNADVTLSSQLSCILNFYWRLPRVFHAVFVIPVQPESSQGRGLVKTEGS